MVKAIILASGIGERFSSDLPKQFTKLAGLPVIVHTLKAFERSKYIDSVIVVTNASNVERVWEYARKYNLKKIEKVLCGGKTRQESSFIGINACDDEDYVIIHDGVRPFVSQKIIENVVKATIEHSAVDVAIASADTIIKVNDKNFIDEIPNRKYMKKGQTPQGFKCKLIKKAHRIALKDGISNSPDDCSLVLRIGIPVYVVEGDEQNIKITYPIDLHIADKLFQLKVENSTEDILSDKIKNKVFVVIGGTSGIGLETVRLIETYNAKVVVLSRNTPIKIDIKDINMLKNAFESILDEHGRMDVVINCAGDLIRKDVEFMSEKEWDYIYDMNIKGAFLLSKVVIPIFKKQGFGNLIFVGSSAYTRGRAGYAAYSSSKAALVNFAQALAEEVEPFNIRVNVVVPSRVATPLRFRNFGKEDPTTLLSPKKVAEEILKASYQDVTGSIFEVK
ncbi:2-C-methyl-D-erythritol 4-phosphate cytidylyltransferase [Hippea alviniae]|uniref:2-C-methyl-D-erythritol 4-phosphate cytidylyltransferase n=1 Tax=Hippea alviniae TaxID=1279027 RepID=UPI0003B5C955|nr:2-C-methyl-D-erythritol 4-phosphate cytidylyltransferase [Hippea alviniae]